MDYHNNENGRRIFSPLASVKEQTLRIRRYDRWVTLYVKELICPSDDELKDRVKSKADNAVKVDKMVDAVRAVSVDNLVYFQ